MPKKDPRVDAYIAAAAPFARPILKHLRKVVHEAAPDVQETIKWGMPSYTGKGIVCGMAAFKAHTTFGFWNTKAVEQALGLKVGGKSADAMGSFGRIRKLSDLPSAAALKRMVKTAVELDRDGVKNARPKAALPVPKDLAAALAKKAKARAFFESLPPSHRREHIEWITEAKRSTPRPETESPPLEP